MALPSVTFSASDLVIGHTTILQLISTGGSPTTTNLRCKVADYDPEQEILRVKFPNSTDGAARTRKLFRSGSYEKLMIETKEFKKALTLFGGKLNDVIEFTSAQLWVLDFQDAAGLVALKTDAFACVIYRGSGANRFEAAGGDDAGTPFSIMIESIKDGDIVFTKDASA